MGAADQVIAVAMAQRGKKYVFGTMGPNTFDCSGLVVYAFKNGAGISLPHFTGSLWTKGSPVSRGSIAPGDLVFPNPSHVGIAISNTEMVVAPHTGAVVRTEKISTVWGARRIISPGTATSGSGPTIVDVGLPGQDQLTGLVDAAKQADKVFGFITNPKNWVRAGLSFAGVSLIVYGLWKFETPKRIIQNTTEVVKNASTK